MIGSIDIKVNAARPNLPLAPLFAFQDSPSSLRVMDVPKSIGNWAITSVKVAVEYPDNTTVEKVAVRSGSVWVATLEGSEVAGKVSNGYEVLADGKDEDGNDVTGYVLGKGDVYILENGTELSRLVGKIAVRYMDEIPDVPTKGDLMNSNGELRLFDGEDWIVIRTDGNTGVYDSQITLQKNGTTVGKFSLNQAEPKTIDIPVPSRTSDIENDSGFITVAAIPSDISAFNNDVGYITEAAIPSNVTAFNNDAGYITQEAIPSEISAFQNDVGYITAEAIPSQVSSFENDAGYLTSVSWGEVQDKPDVALKNEIPSNVSELVNDVGYITASALPSQVSELENDVGYITASAIPSTVGAFQNDVGYLTSVSWGEVQDKPDVALMSDIPSKVSELDNDTGFITANALPSKVSELDNDAGYITASAIPSNVSAFNNDAGYITASAVPSNVSQLNNDVGYITASAISGKRDYTDLTFNTPSSAGRIPYINGLDNLRWARAYIQKFNLTYDGTAYTLSEFIIHPEYGMMWYKASSYFMTTKDGTNFKLLDNDTNVMLQTTISLLKSGDVNFTYGGKSGSISLVSNEKVNFALDYQTMNGNLYVTSDNITIGTYDPTNVLNTYIDLSSKRNKTDMSAVVGTTYASWNLSALYSATYSPALELKWGTYNVFGEEQECWLVDDEYRQVCFFLLPELNMLYWGVRNQDGSYIAAYGESITLSYDRLSIETISDADEITCTRTSKDEMPETSTIATMKDLQGFQNINDKRDWWDNTTPASVDATGKFTINTFSVTVGSDSYFLDQFSASGGTSTWMRSISSYPNITTTDGLDFTLNYDSSTNTNFTMDDLKPGPAKGTIDGSNFNVTANFKLTTFALKDELPSKVSELDNDTGFITASSIPSDISVFNNDVGYITASTMPAIPSKTSDLDNDSGFITASAIPSKTSDLVNDSGFITESAIPSNVGAFNNDVGYLTASSSALTEKRDYNDLTNPGSVYPSETHRIREFNLGIQGHNPSRYTLNKFSTNVPNYGSMWADDEEYWNYAVTTSNGEDFAFQKYGESEPVTTFTMEQVQAGAVAFTMVESQDEYSCTLNASMYETTLALKDYVDANLNVSGIGCSTVTMSGVYADTTTFSYNVVVAQ